MHVDHDENSVACSIAGDMVVYSIVEHLGVCSNWDHLEVHSMVEHLVVSLNIEHLVVFSNVEHLEVYLIVVLSVVHPSFENCLLSNYYPQKIDSPDDKPPECGLPNSWPEPNCFGTSSLFLVTPVIASSNCSLSSLLLPAISMKYFRQKNQLFK